MKLKVLLSSLLTVACAFSATAPEDTKCGKAVTALFSDEGGHGTAYILKTPNGNKFLMTAAHVCARSKVMTSKYGVHAVLFKNEFKDTCILSISDVNKDYLTPYKNPTVGQKVNILGFPLECQYDAQQGTVVGSYLFEVALPTGYYGDKCGEHYETPVSVQGKFQACVIRNNTLELKMLVRPGNSGGPVFNANGNVVGHVIGSSGNDAGYMIPISDVLEVLSESGLDKPQ